MLIMMTIMMTERSAGQGSEVSDRSSLLAMKAMWSSFSSFPTGWTSSSLPCSNSWCYPSFSFLASKTYQFYLFFPFIALLFQRFTSAISFLLLIFTFFPLFLSEWIDIYLAIKFLLGLLILPFLFLSLLLFTRCVFLLLSFLLLSLLLCSKSIVQLLLVCRPAHFIYYTKSCLK